MAHFLTKVTVTVALVLHAMHTGGADHAPHPAHRPPPTRPHAMRMVGAKA